MRARVHHLWPYLSRTYGLKPSDLMDMAAAELNAYLEDMADQSWQ